MGALLPALLVRPDFACATPELLAGNLPDADGAAEAADDPSSRGSGSFFRQLRRCAQAHPHQTNSDKVSKRSARAGGTYSSTLREVLVSSFILEDLASRAMSRAFVERRSAIDLHFSGRCC